MAPRCIGKFGELSLYEKAFVQQCCKTPIISNNSYVLAWECGTFESTPKEVSTIIDRVNQFFGVFTNFTLSDMRDIEAVMVLCKSEYPLSESSASKCTVHTPNDVRMVIIDGWHLEHFVDFTGDTLTKFDQFLSRFKSFIYVDPIKYPLLFSTYIGKYGEQLNPLIRHHYISTSTYTKSICLHLSPSSQYTLIWLNDIDPLILDDIHQRLHTEYKNWREYALRQYGCTAYKWWYANVNKVESELFMWFGS